MNVESHSRRRNRAGRDPRRTLRNSAGVLALPWPEWLRHYHRDWLKPDVMAGLTVAAVVIPKALAYATIAGLPVEVGLYTVFAPMLIYAMLGTSRPLSVSTTTTLAILAAAALTDATKAGGTASLLTASATLTCLVGIILIAARLLRLGFVADFISEPVLVGFKAGIGLVIVVDQLPKLLGIHFQKGAFFHNLAAMVQGVPHASLATMAVGVTVLALLIGMERLVPRAPAPLIAVGIGIAAVSLLGLQSHGVETVGHVPTGLPPLTLPDPDLVMQLLVPAMGIALMSFTETIAAGRAFVQSGEPAPDPNRELLATGFACLGGAFLGAMAAGGGTTQTAVNRRCGARSQLAGLVTAVVALGAMLVLAPLIGLMPEAALAAVVIAYSVGLIQPVEFRAILGIRRTEFIWAVVAFAGVVLLGTLNGIAAAIIVSLLALAYQTSDPPVYVLARKPGTNVFRPQSAEHPADVTYPGMVMLRPEGRVYFANARHIGHRMRHIIAAANPRVVVLDLAGVFDLEYTALRMLTEAEKKMREGGVMLWLVELNPNVLEMVRRSSLGDTLGRERLFQSMDLAVDHYLADKTFATARL